MIRPTPRAAILLAAGIAVALVPVLVGSRYWPAWLAYTAATLAMLGVDAVLAWPRRAPEITVDTPASLFIGSRGTLDLKVRLRQRPPVDRIDVRFDLDPLLEAVETRSEATEAGEASLAIPLMARRRGEAEIRTLWLRWTGPLGLMSYALRQPLGRRIPVVPDVSAVKRAALRFFGSRDLLVGEKMELHTGDGSEFDRLREFVPGLDHRSMDWKASARHRRLLCREFRAERNHQILIAYDTGHLMSEPVAGIPRIDHAIKAGLLLSYFSLRAGDRVGLYGFDKGPNLYVGPRGGLGNFGRLQLSSARLAYSTEETNFTLGLAELSLRLRRRSLIVLFTDFVDTVTAELMVEDLERLSRRHLVVFVTLDNPDLAATAGAAPESLHHMAWSVVADDFLREREIVHRRLVRLGIQTIDAPPHGISPQLLNRYLDIKRREMIA